MPCCSAVNCSNRTENGKRLFRFPQGKRNEERRKLWLRNIGRIDLPNTVYVCQDHFTDNQFENNRDDGKKLLRWNAVPTVFAHRKPPKPRKLPFKRIRLDEISSNENIEEILAMEENENDPIDEVTEKQQDKITELKRALKASHKKLNQLEQKLQEYKKNFENLFHTDQITYIVNQGMQGFSWSNETINNALKLYMSCGKSGYEEIRKQNLPYPCIRTLQQRISNFKFNPGILDDILDLLKTKIHCLQPEERHAILLVDEMAIKAGLAYDSSISEIVGKPTMSLSGGKSSSDVLATHALVFMLAGITTRWKQTVAYEFTGHSYDSKEMKDKLFVLIKKCNDIGITIKAIVSDMGSQNRSLMRLCNIVASRHGKIFNSCQHPCNNSELLYFVSDPPHILKNIRNAFCQGHIFYINDCIVQKYKLPSNAITVEAVKLVVNCDASLDLKIAPYLKESILNPSHFQKMNVGTALTLFNNDVAAAINYCIFKKIIDEKFHTTAWFIKMIFKWFSLMTARHKKLGLSLSNQEIYDESISFLNDFIYVIRNIRVGEKGTWKPFQCGILLTTQTAIDFQNYYINHEHFRYVLLGRLSQDALENLFSVVRSRNAVPGPYEFKVALRLITLSQYEFKPKHGSYTISDSEQLIKFAAVRNNLETDIETNKDERELNEMISLDFTSESSLSSDEEQALYYLIGSVLFKIKNKFKTCNLCLSALITSCTDTSVQCISNLTKMKEYKTNSLVLPSLKTFQFLYSAELFFRKNEIKLMNNEIKLNNLISTFFKLHQNSMQNIPNCHDTLQKTAMLFLKTRMFFALRKFNKSKATTLNLNYNSSRSIHMRMDEKK